MIAALLWWACAGRGCGVDPAMEPFVDAAAAWDQGRAAMERGDTEAAIATFAVAEGLDPMSPVLPAWRARALEEAGREAEALAVLDAALERFPDDTTLRFNRAGLRARTGELDLAAVDLHMLISMGQVSPEEAGRDPDLALLRDRPELSALVPAARIEVRLHGEEGSVLLGERYTAEMELILPASAQDLQVRDMGEPTGLLRRERVVEDQLLQEARGLVSRVEHTWRCVAPGKASAGPWLLTAGGGSALTERLDVEVVALGARTEASPPGPEGLLLPSATLAGKSPPWMGEVEGRLVLMGGPSAALQVQEADGSEVPVAEEWELRREGQTVWRARVYAAEGPVQARILEAGQEVLVGP